MCFPADISAGLLDTVTYYCCSTLAAESASDSDPGLCVLVPERLEQPEILMHYGHKAKTTVISKEEAYETAAAHGVHLSEHGGSGQGVIGALAGAGLRLTGNDGRFKGKFRIPSRNGTATVREIHDCGIDAVQSMDGARLDESEAVHVGEWVKLVLIDGKTVLLVVSAGGFSGSVWKACDRKIFKDY
jgi:hypothetical protein